MNVGEAKVYVVEAEQDLVKAKQDYAEQYNKLKLESEEKLIANKKVRLI